MGNDWPRNLNMLKEKKVVQNCALVVFQWRKMFFNVFTTGRLSLLLLVNFLITLRQYYKETSVSESLMETLSENLKPRRLPEEKGMPLLHRKQMLQNLPILLASWKASNVSESLQSEIQNIFCSLCQATQISNKVNNKSKIFLSSYKSS